MALDLARLVAGAVVRLPGTSGPVRLIAVEPGSFWSFVYEHADGLDRVTLSEEELGEVELFEVAETPAFDGDAEQFRLGIEARRIKTTFTYEMAAVAVSNIRPLPHQLEAVYDEFLTQPRLRFLLADDPGAGKTIMAGLYAKELILRRSGDRILLVVPANLRPQWVRELDERFQLSFVDMAALFEASPNENPWDQHSHVIVSRDFLRQDHVLEAFREAELEWDLAILDEAHGYSAYVDGWGRINKKSQRYVAAEAVSERAHRLILMTATPHRGSDRGFWALLRLLDPPVFGDRCPRVVRVPKHLFRRVSKEVMCDMKGEPLFKPRHAHTLDFQLSPGERELYDAVTEFVSTKLHGLEHRDDRPPLRPPCPRQPRTRRLAPRRARVERAVDAGWTSRQKPAKPLTVSNLSPRSSRSRKAVDARWTPGRPTVVPFPTRRS